MNPPVLLLDCDNLLHRAFHAMGGKMSHEETSTGMLFGFLRDLRTLSREFGTERLAFCFDSRRSLRAELCPAYKANRRQQAHLTPEDRQAKDAMRKQVEELRTTYLPALGYRNIFYAEGFEADDLIASACTTFTGKVTECVAVSSDKDLYQLLALLNIWRPPLGKTPGQLVTEMTFAKTYGIEPHQWIRVKALAGCPSDNIRGAERVGEATAIRYIRGELREGRKDYQSAVRFRDSPEYKVNKKLVRLPFPGTPPCPLVEDRLDRKAWNALCKQLGLNSLRML